MINFIDFVKKFKKYDSELIESIIFGYILMTESLSTDDANGKPLGITVTHKSPASTVQYQQNLDNEYFDQTLDNEKHDKAIKAQIGHRQAAFPQAGRTSVGKDSINQFQSTQNVNNL